MTLRQTLLRLAYPIYRLYTSYFGTRGKTKANTNNKAPITSFYDLDLALNNGETLSISTLKGKWILIVNTASDCVYTSQYKGLQQLYDRLNGSLAVIAFPSNDFRQEKGTDEEISRFCAHEYSTGFPLAAKSHVTGKGMNEIYQWLTDPAHNGWNNQSPVWNFNKYLIDTEGKLAFYFGPAVPPAYIGNLLARTGK